MDEGKQKENDFKEQFERRNALLIRTLEKLATAEDEIQSLKHERQALQEETQILRNSRSGLSKECTNQEKTISTMEKERQRLRDRVEELENRVEELKKDVLDLEGHMSKIKVIECGSDEAERISLTDTLHTRQFEKENADLVEKTKTLTKENESFKTECKRLREEGEQLKIILKIFQETRIESDKTLLSRFSKECKSPDKTMLRIEMDKQQLRDKIVQLEIEVKSLREIVINLEEKMSTINAVECELDETDGMSLTVDTMQTRRLEQENADLMEKTKALTKENQCFKKETKQLEEEREHFKCIIKIFQQTGMESDKVLLSRIFKGCKFREKTLSKLEKERQQLRDKIIELENEVDDLHEKIIDLEENMSTMKVAECTNDTAESMRRLEKENAVLVKTTKSLTNENENYKTQNKELQKEREYFKRIIKIFQETRIESETALLRKNFTRRINCFFTICIQIDERITIACALKSEPSKVFMYYRSPIDGDFPATILLDHNMKVCKFGSAAEKQYRALRGEELDQFYLFRLTCSKEAPLMSHAHMDVAKKTNLDAVRMYQEFIQYLKYSLMEPEGFILPEDNWVMIVPRQWGNAGHEFMTETAIKAGIKQDRIVTVLAPMAYIAYAEVMETDSSKVELLKPGMNILLIDAQETVHITVYQRKRGGGLREVLPPHILHCGQCFFENILVEIVGPQVWAEFCEKNPEDLLDLQHTISSMTSPQGKHIIFSIPYFLRELFQRNTGTSIGDYVKTSTFSESIEFCMQSKIKIKPSLFVDRCADVLMGFQKTLVTTSFVSGDIVLLLVGGFAQYNPFQEAVKLAFPHHGVIIPNHDENVVVKGGALIGQNVCKYSCDME